MAMGVCSGHTYEYAEISRWLQTKATSPVTNLPVPSTQLFKNHHLRSQMVTWAEGNNRPEIISGLGSTATKRGGDESD
eukprot:COSAG05_NODE_24261_length_252_cov_1.673203_1_plen_77_part_10